MLLLIYVIGLVGQIGYTYNNNSSILYKMSNNSFKTAHQSNRANNPVKTIHRRFQQVSSLYERLLF